MNVLDIILIVPLLFALYRGFKKGLVYMAASLLALILGILGAMRFRTVVGSLLDSWFNIAAEHLNVIAFAVTFILIVMIVHLAAFLVDKLIKAVALSFLNRLLGMLFGVLVTAFVLSMLLWPVNTINQEREIIKQERIEGSLLWEPISVIAPTIFPYLKREEFKGWIPRQQSPEDQEEVPVDRKKKRNEAPVEVAGAGRQSKIYFLNRVDLITSYRDEFC
ncbi:MAG: CvpA family protein [Bacteroidales bacterium]|nr:CvpA family protein [Bacteroidales bacterium]MBN2698380.1 CvpA family protein [Bacteroidales bacterium]